MTLTHWLRPLFSRPRGTLLVALAATLTGGLLAGCSKSDDKTAEAKKTTVGYLYVGTKDDYGYNQAHAEGAGAVKTMPDIAVQESEKVAETDNCEQVMATMVDQGDATLIFATSFGYFPHVKEVAKKYPKVTFLHAGGLLKDGDPPNVGTYFAYIDELEWLCGMAAGSATKSKKLGYIAAKPIPPVLRDINAFELGAKSVNPDCTLTVIFTGDWFLPDKEADAVKSLAAQGIDVISGHVDSPKVMIQTAEGLGLMTCGYHYNCSALAPKGYLTGAEWNWGPMNKRFVEDFKAGKPMPHNYMGSVKDDSVKMSPFSALVPKEAQDKIDAVKKQMIAGTFQMFKGPLKDNQGKTVIPDGKAFGDQDGELWGMNYLVEGVIGKL